MCQRSDFSLRLERACPGSDRALLCRDELQHGKEDLVRDQVGAGIDSRPVNQDYDQRNEKENQPD